MKLALDKLIGRGGFSRVYVARVTSSSDTKVAVKKMHITKHVQNSVLRHEACAYILLAGHSSVPEVYAWGRSQYYDYLALELLGEDVFSVREGLTVRNFVILACAMLDALEHVHEHGIVHCDVKPGNFLFSRASPGQLKLIDFGLAIPFRTGEHVPASTSERHLRGTELYASIPAHKHCTLARRDDMESLAYTLVHLACGRLPWAHPSVRGINILHRKAAWCTEQTLPPVLAQFVTSTRALGFAAEPEYALWRAVFRALVPDLGLDLGLRFDPADEGLRVIDWAPQIQPQAQIQLELLNPEQPPSSDSDSDSIPSSDDGWVPTSVWPAPVSVRLSHLLGDEGAVVREHALERIEEPPEMGKAWLVQCDRPERMMDF